MKNQWKNAIVLGALLTMSACSQSKRVSVTGLEPSAGSSAGSVVRVIGTGLQSDTALGAQVYFGDEKARVIELKGNSEIVVEAPSGTPKTAVDVTVIFDDGREFKLPKGYFYKEPIGAGFNVDALSLK